MALPPDFFERVFEVARRIPQGKVCTYGAIANHVGTGRAARMVGWAMSKSHTEAEYVPAHRVVNRNGQLTGKHHFAGPNLMQELLENEGHTIVDDGIENFKEVVWTPDEEKNSL